jgi:hypothetical protein
MAVFWDVAPCSPIYINRLFISAIMEAISSSETSVSVHQTTRGNTEVQSSSTHRRQNLKSHVAFHTARFVISLNQNIIRCVDKIVGCFSYIDDVLITVGKKQSTHRHDDGINAIHPTTYLTQENESGKNKCSRPDRTSDTQ